MIGLTAHQRELLAYLQEREACPSYLEMKDALGIASTKLVQERILALEERGRIHVRRDRCGRARPRAIKVLRPLPSKSGLCVVFGPDHWESRARRHRRMWAREEAAQQPFECLGCIAASVCPYPSCPKREAA